MRWSDEGFVLAARPHGESGAVVHLLTRERGRHAGLVRGGAGRRLAAALQPGNEVRAEWRGRIEDQLGTLAVELAQARAAGLLGDALRLAALASACALAEAALPEREPHPGAYEGFGALLDALAGAPDWPATYARWELALLAELGYGLDLARCAATGETEDLAYVSPRSGQAVGREAAGPWRDRLLPLPAFFLGAQAPAEAQDVRDALELTGLFLERRVLAPHGRREPAARTRLVAMLRRAATTSRSLGKV
jgi:DNA repair protein RecO (recombination protein O)